LPSEFIATLGRFGVKQEAVNLQPGWNTILELPAGSVGKIVSIWYVGNTGGMQAAFRATANQATEPQFGGELGINVEGMCGPGWDGLITSQAGASEFSAHTQHFDVDYHVNGVGYIMCHWKIPFTFTDGFLLEFNSGSNQVTNFYTQVEWAPGTVVDSSVNWVLHADQTPPPTGSVVWNSVGYLQEWIIWSVVGKRTIYIGSWIWLSNQQCNNGLGFLEGDFSNYINTVLSWRTSGTEDYWYSQFYYSNAVNAIARGMSPSTLMFDDVGYPITAQQNCKVAGYRFNPEDQAFYSDDNNTFTWQNGDYAVGGMPGQYTYGANPFNCVGCTAELVAFNYWYETS
jgi:hypothetical protein